MGFYKLDDIRNIQYFMIPKSLFEEPYKSKLNNNAKMIYGFLLDRLELSRVNEWADDDGSVYLYYTRKNLAKDVGVSEGTVIKCMKDLTDLGLLKEVEQSFGKPNKIYVGKVEPKEDETELDSRATEIVAQGSKNCSTGLQKLEPNNTNINNTNKSNKLSSSMKDGRAVNQQRTLINIQKPDTKKKKLSHKELAIQKIASAKVNQISWSEVSFRDFTYYYIEKHNEKMKKPITFDRFTSVSIIRDDLIKAYNIPLDKVCIYIDVLIDKYKNHPNAWDSLTFNMIQKNKVLLNDLIQSVSADLNPVEQKYKRATEQREQRMSKADKEVF